MSVFQKPPEDLNEDQVSALLDWANLDPIIPSPTASLELAGALRNVDRWAQRLGPHLIAELVMAGLLSPEQDPREALRDLIKKAGE